MILEGIVTTRNAAGEVNIAPMGPKVDREITRIRLRPFQSSTTFANLKHDGSGVLHVVDDVELFAQAAVSQLAASPDWFVEETQLDPPNSRAILADACRWYAFQVVSIDDSRPRAEIECQIVDQGRRRDFFGFNRAKHAVIEAAILATRLDFLDLSMVQNEFERLALIVEKTAGDQEQRAFAFLLSYLQQTVNEGAASPTKNKTTTT